MAFNFAKPKRGKIHDKQFSAIRDTLRRKNKEKKLNKLLQNGKILHVLLQNLNDFLKIQLLC